MIDLDESTEIDEDGHVIEIELGPGIDVYKFYIWICFNCEKLYDFFNKKWTQNLQQKHIPRVIENCNYGKMFFCFQLRVFLLLKV